MQGGVVGMGTGLTLAFTVDCVVLLECRIELLDRVLNGQRHSHAPAHAQCGDAALGFAAD
jgi:hypothetical protein